MALVVSGGNVDPLLLTRLVEHGLTAAGRYLMVRVVLADKPGCTCVFDQRPRENQARPVDRRAPPFGGLGVSEVEG